MTRNLYWDVVTRRAAQYTEAQHTPDADLSNGLPILLAHAQEFGLHCITHIAQMCLLAIVDADAPHHHRHGRPKPTPARRRRRAHHPRRRQRPHRRTRHHPGRGDDRRRRPNRGHWPGPRRPPDRARQRPTRRGRPPTSPRRPVRTARRPAGPLRRHRAHRRSPAIRETRTPLTTAFPNRHHNAVAPVGAMHRNLVVYEALRTTGARPGGSAEAAATAAVSGVTEGFGSPAGASRAPLSGTRRVNPCPAHPHDVR